MRLTNLDKITRLAELKIKIDELPKNSLAALSLTNEFNNLYLELENDAPYVYESEIDELINSEIQKIKTNGE